MALANEGSYLCFKQKYETKEVKGMNQKSLITQKQLPGFWTPAVCPASGQAAAHTGHMPWGGLANHSCLPRHSQNSIFFLSKINKAPKFPIPSSFSWSFKMNSVSRLPFFVSEGRKTDTQENFPINQSLFHFKASKLSQAFQRSPFLSEILHLFNKAGRIYYLGTGKHFSFSIR